MNSDDQLADLRLYLDKNRDRGTRTRLTERWLAENAAHALTPDLLYALSEQRLWPCGHSPTPRHLAQFMVLVTRLYSVNSVLDPTCGTGVLLHSVSIAAKAKCVHGIDQSLTSTKLARSLFSGGATIHHGDALAPHADLLEKYDLIVADPPLGARLDGRQELAGLGAFKGELGHALTVWACARLEENGAALVVVSPGFLWGRSADKLHKAIAELGGRVRALIHLPSGTLPSTGADSYLVLLERGEQGPVFVGQFKTDDEHQRRLFDNLKQSQEGDQPSLGRSSRLSEFKGFESYSALERLERLAAGSDWVGVPATEVFTEHRTLGQKSQTPLQHGPTSCYLRLIGRPKAVLDLEELPRAGKQSRDVLHLHIAPDRADPRYLVHWFNSSQVGQATLMTVARSGTIPRVTLADLLDATLYLPPLADQLRAIAGAAHLTRIRAAADELEAALWDGTGDVDAILRDIATTDQEERFDDWIESLPFPLASILWRHRAGGGSPRERYEVLLHFFEATAAFLATVHLSAFMSSDEQWQRAGSKLNGKLSAAGLSLDHRASFGAWKLIAEYLSAISGKRNKDAKGATLNSQIYGTPSEGVLSMLTSRDVRSVLQVANRLRNDWGGHVGAVSDEKAAEVEAHLLELVHRLRGAFGRSWLGYELIQPGAGRLKSGTHYYKARRLMGTRSSPFAEVDVESLEALEDDGLYLFDCMNRTGLKLRPFVRVMPSPEKEATACFIFNRCEGGSHRFVSYHFEQESEIKLQFPGVDEALARMHEFDNDE